MKARLQNHTLIFKSPSGTSRGVLREKQTHFIILEDNGQKGIGECGMFKGLSTDDRPDFYEKLNWAVSNIDLGIENLIYELREFPSIQFGLEMAFLDLETPSPFILYPSKFTENKDHIPINGLIWMGDKDFMKSQIIFKLKEGYKCLKLKIGAIDFEAEIDLLKYIRSQFSKSNLEIRVDANGAFKVEEALYKLDRLSKLKIHSIEQPIKQGQIGEMSELCSKTPLPIALDEELIGIFYKDKKEQLLVDIAPQYIILKPTLVGGISGSIEWIELAGNLNIGWWITSALESNVGLNAIAQWTYTLKNPLPQGLGTGQLFTNNIISPLFVKNGTLRHQNDISWNFKT